MNSTLILPSVTAQVAAHLRRAILEGRLRPGQAVRQIEISNLLGVSQGVVREALRVLQGEGLVVLEPRKGARVAQLALEELREIYDLRAVIEPIVLRKSAEAHRDEHVARVEELLSELDQVVRDGDRARYQRLNHEFHFAIFEAGGRTIACRLLEVLWGTSNPYHILYGSTLDMPRMQEEHVAMVEAWRRRRGEELAMLQDRHRRHTGAYFEQINTQKWTTPETRDGAVR